MFTILAYIRLEVIQYLEKHSDPECELSITHSLHGISVALRLPVEQLGYTLNLPVVEA